MKGPLFDKVIDLIEKETDESDLKAISEMCWHRVKTLRRQEATRIKRKVKVGTRICVKNIRPKYLNGVVADVRMKREDAVMILVPDRYEYRRRAGREVWVPWECIGLARN